MKKLITTVVISLTAGFAWANSAQIQEEIDQAAWFNQVLESAKSGDAQAQAILAYRYGYAIDVRKDTNTALEWAKKSAKQGNLYGLLYYYWNRDLSKISITKEELGFVNKVKSFARKGDLK